jgi:inosine-uridine nucleoside N-ribohydrolase
LVREIRVAAHVHGETGLDGPDLPAARAAEVPVSEIADRVRASERPVTLVATGPLTNVAHYLETPGGVEFERIVIMGGSIADGNVTPAAEFNIWADPEAAQHVFQSGLDVTMIGLDVTHKAILAPPIAERLRAAGRVGTFVAELNDFSTRYHQRTYGWDGSPIHDAVAVAHVIRPGLVETRLRNVEVEVESELCRGRTVVDLWERTGRPTNVHVGVDLDSEAFFDLLVERIASLG